MRASTGMLTVVAAALLSAMMIVPTTARPFEDVNMNTDVSVDGTGNILVRWMDGAFDEYHVGWRVNGGPRSSRIRPGDKTFTVLMPYSPGSVYQVEVQGCLKHTFGHDQCTSWDSVTCGAAQTPCPGSPGAALRRR